MMLLIMQFCLDFEIILMLSQLKKKSILNWKSYTSAIVCNFPGTGSSSFSFLSVFFLAFN